MANKQKKNLKKTDLHLKRYNIKSGEIVYQITMVGNVMGQNITGSGKQYTYFKDWGNTELKKEYSKQVTKINLFGKKKTDINEIHNMNKLENGISYSVDFKNKIIYSQPDKAMKMIQKFYQGNAEQAGKQILEQMGGKKIGNEKILGYTCEVWEIPGGKQWIYKGVPLKIDMNVMGVHNIYEAKSAEFNTKISDKFFQLPDYPMQEEQNLLNNTSINSNDDFQMDEKAKKQLLNMTFEEYKDMLRKEDPEEIKGKSEKELKQSFLLMKKKWLK